MKKEIEKKIERRMMTPEEKVLDTASTLSTIITTQILSSKLINGLQQDAKSRIQSRHIENLQKLENDFINENIKNNQIHEEITRTQDQTDKVIDAVFGLGSKVSNDVLLNLLSSLDKSSETIASLRIPDTTAKRHDKKIYKDNNIVLGEDDIEEI